MIRAALLGATGSIGASALELAREFRGRIRFVSMAARSNDAALVPAAEEFGVTRIALADPEAAARARRSFRGEVLEGEEGLARLASDADADVIVNALVGSAGLGPTVAALQAGKRVALANKESVVLAGELLVAIAKEHGGTILPVDSEHGGLHQCLGGAAADDVRRLILTASGGPFLRRDVTTLRGATPQEVLRHPTWSMGERITVDCATLMNKGFEIVEARWLFGIPPERIEVLVHPQSIVHAMVEFVDGSMVAQLSRPDMRLPLLYAMSYPERWSSSLPRLDVTALQGLEFEAPDPARSPGLGLARKALALGGTAPAALNAADEEAVRLFLAGAIGFEDLTRLVDEVLDEHRPAAVTDLEAVRSADRMARSRLTDLAASRSRR
ncbi:MAG: 1-deoxy-D-xylulose-5-phosphate reductoisomerase [Candidatus Eisenbacteria bacterium]|uniref:1-deoxy-D-xylulose 5-phosphate reductoisomerase n=1 Tax=Eiseniibacteriota bacterium TaxID=2212470 RepID=A0A538TK90_UNCEI|nr:MAG: 1-deoxy-D-xylulose-5-phosphate reductoisomerase [Candidatus Eisenbacteria bacterium]